MDKDLLWKSVLGEIELSVSKGNYATWFRTTELLDIDNSGKVVIGTPNVFIQNQLEKRFGDLLRDTLSKNGILNPSLHFKNSTNGQKPKDENQTPIQIQTSPSAISPNLSETKDPIMTHVSGVTHSYRSGINARYTFDTFVVGGSNELAYAACRGAAEQPGAKYNPLFLYGGVGIGKTHLIQALGNEIAKNDPTKSIVYVSTEQFVQEFLDAIRYKKNTDFASYYRGADVLIVDDIQFIAGKEKTQEEFFHTFNALHQANKQIIISSDRHPNDIPTLSDRLQSRFGWGMSIDMYAPDFETRCAIIAQKAESMGHNFDSELVSHIAGVVKNNVRELEGVINQIVAFCEIRGIDPSVAVARGLFGKQNSRTKHSSPRRVIDVVANHYGVTIEDIVSPKRDKDIVFPRQVAMYLLREDLGISFPKIAGLLGRKDHTTAIHSVEKIAREASLDPQLKSNIDSLRGLI